TGDQQAVTRCSLASRAAEHWQDYLKANTTPDPRERWRPIHNDATRAWWRPQPADGEFVPRLAMHWTVLTDVGVELPGVVGQASLSKLGERYGVFDPNPGVPEFTSGGKIRLAVLTRDFTDEVMEDPADWNEDPALSDAAHPPPEVTEGGS